MGELLKKFTERLADEAQEIAANSPEVDAVQSALSNPQIVKIVSLLQANPILVPATLKFVQTKIGEIAGATLSVLYSPAELDEMKRKAGLT